MFVMLNTLMANNRFVRNLFHLYWRFSRPMTLGVRIFLQDENQKILLVRHTYISGWYLPGGGVERGETCEEAAVKELDEEAGLEPVGQLKSFGVYLNARASKSDHVILYLCDSYKIKYEFKPTREIAEIGFFDINALPQDITPSTFDRIQEVLFNKPVSQTW